MLIGFLRKALNAFWKNFWGGFHQKECFVCYGEKNGEECGKVIMSAFPPENCPICGATAEKTLRGRPKFIL